ncbi:MAG: hypothetical protein FJY20_05780 [Bacteroidetes bacterium]|nr:hypothetical protein [Bacteroidota bacterium]
MEVHAHTHTPQKRWTHYFWEFLMLFVAVTLGFFVENKREHYIENKREKIYIKQLVQDLKTDTAFFLCFGISQYRKPTPDGLAGIIAETIQAG